MSNECHRRIKSTWQCPNLLHAARMAYISKNLQHSGKLKCVRLLRPWRGAKLFSTSKTAVINMNIDMDFCVRTLFDHICAYARFINEASEEDRSEVLKTSLVHQCFSLENFSSLHSKEQCHTFYCTTIHK